MNNNFESTRNISETTKNFSEIIKMFLQPSPIDLAIAGGHKKLIENAISGETVNPDAIYFLCGYKTLVKQETRKKDIADKAQAFLENSANPQEIELDWLEFFFEKAKLVTNNDMQLIWARLLAEEANMPGKIHLSLLQSISVMRYEQADFFCNISRFALRAYKKDIISPLIFISTNREAYNDSNINPSKLKELERLGLIECDFNQEYIFERKMEFVSGNKVLTVYGDPSNEQKIKAGNVIFTEDGKALYDIIDSSYKKHRDDIFGFIVNKFKIRNCRVLVNGIDF